MSRRKTILRTALLGGMLTCGARGEPGDFIDVFVQPGSGGLYFPWSLTFGPDGSLYVCGLATPFELPPNVVRYDGVTGDFTGVFTSGLGAVPRGLTFGPDGDLYVCAGAAVQRFDGLTGAYIDDFVAPRETLANNGYVTFGPDHNLYVSSFCCHVVERFDGTSGEFMGVFASGDELAGARGGTFGPDGDFYVCSYGTQSVVRYDGTTGTFVDVFAAGPELLECRGLRFGPFGNLYVVNRGNVLRYHGRTGQFMGVFSTGLSYPQDLTFGPDGNLYVADVRPGSPPDNDVVVRYEGPHPPPIPAVSEWGLAATTLLVLVAGALLLARRRVAAA